MRRIEWLLGMRASSTPGSNARRIFSRIIAISAGYLLIEGLLLGGNVPALSLNLWQATIACLGALLYFSVICYWLLFLARPNYAPNPIRLVNDILNSGVFTILSFSAIYRIGGLVDTLSLETVSNARDAVYFSAVTFSTLGFGDFRPAANIRLVASLQALIGNLHLGLLAGAVFYALSVGRPTKSGAKNSEKETDKKAN